ncbi:MAG: hypothetical protein FJY40_03600 [Betaproteobacteria bacterium]|nr:hypothetical protein [Betaproteobacteria bacterium]
MDTAISAEDRNAIAERMIKHLIEGREAVARTAHAVLPLAEKANDRPRLELLTQRLDIHESNAWMLRSLLKKWPLPGPPQ